MPCNAFHVGPSASFSTHPALCSALSRTHRILSTWQMAMMPSLTQLVQSQFLAT
eukprot:CAMPEP_0171777580 /NCGR_PEP_ID=MMETSP0991-20121206/57874_1 /TAXON_ID=483369 /ORGANISM="non described non described, Strain CCMP2098" /LENGTH=53 /DNA_ID=CAMNT_0012384337 /DNA_START=58 /DNA_END=219 /DNA_ORIENTATION=+